MAAQPALDTIKDCLKQRPQLFGKLDSRNSFISNSDAKIFGAAAGLSFGSRLHLGIGYNQLYPPSDNFDKVIYYTNANNALDSSNALLKLFYFSAYVEYIYYKTKHWQLSIPLQLGMGQTYYQYNRPGEKIDAEKHICFIYEPAVSIEYKFMKWFGLGADIGFRFMATGYGSLNRKFNSPTYAFNFIIYYTEIYKSVFKK